MERKLQTIEKWSQAQKRTATVKFDDLFTEDSIIELKGLGASSTLIDAKTASEYSKAVGSDWKIKKTWLEGESVHAVLTEQNEWLDAAGIPEASYEGEFFIKDDKIDTIHLQPTLETVQEQARALSKFSIWVGREHPQQYSDILVNGKLIHDENTGRLLVKLMHQWREETESKLPTSSE